MRGDFAMITHHLLVLLLALVLTQAQHTDHEDLCPPILDFDVDGDGILSNNEVIAYLTHPCRYERQKRPGDKPLKVTTRAYVYLLKSYEAHSLKFKLHLLLQFRYVDDRLSYGHLAPSTHEIVGEGRLRDRIWIPHVYLSNEHSSVVMGSHSKNILVTIYPDGVVLFALRLKTTLFCWLKLGKFPFDQQQCPLILESWTYNSSDLVLTWEADTPVVLPPNLHLTEYSLISMWTSENQDLYTQHNRLQGPSEGNYSGLTVTFHLAREMGFYMMDYFAPSILLVVISWVSFWLDANALSGRIGLGTSTMLTFITLSTKTGSSLPKVSYIKANEVWFIGCTAFIFGSLVEFAFVNTIWRRRKNVELKKVTSKYILRSAVTPSAVRRNLVTPNVTLERSNSCPSGINEIGVASTSTLTYKNSSSMLDIPTAVHYQNQRRELEPDTADVELRVPDTAVVGGSTSLTTMTPQDIAQWIDKRSRILFPSAFIVFNAIYWIFVMV